MALIVNMDGWVRGLGLELMRMLLLDLIQPDVIVRIEVRPTHPPTHPPTYLPWKNKQLIIQRTVAHSNRLLFLYPSTHSNRLLLLFLLYPPTHSPTHSPTHPLTSHRDKPRQLSSTYLLLFLPTPKSYP